MTITTLPDVAEFGGTKADEYAELDASKQLAAAAYNALTGRVVAAFAAIGLDDGSTSGSLREGLGDVVDVLTSFITSQTSIQIVSTSTATITTARHVLVTYAGGTCTLTLPDAVAAREITIWKANTSSNTIILARSAGDTASGTINAVAASYTLTQGYYNDFEGARYDVVGQAALAWWVNTEWMAIADLRTSLLTIIGNISNLITAAGYSAQTISGTSGTITSALDVYLTNAGATLTITLPDAVADRRIRIHKANSATTQTITLVRSVGDSLGEINDVAASFDIVMTNITGTRRSFMVSASAALEWHVDSGLNTGLATLGTTVGTNTTNISANTTSINLLKNAVVDATTTVAVAAGTRCLVLQNAGATINVTMPDASTAERCLIVKDNAATTQTVNIIRSAADVTAVGEINGVAATYAATWTAIPGSASRTSFSVTGTAAARWNVDFGIWVGFAGLMTSLQAVQAGTINSVQVVSTSSATISSPVVVVTYSSGRCDLTLPATSTRFSHTIINRKTDTTGIRLVPAGGSDAICGNAGGANYDIPTSTTAAANGANRNGYLVVCPASNTVDVC